MTNVLLVYQGADSDNERSHFYSSDKSFAADYGLVKKYRLLKDNFFESADKNHIEELLSHVGSIIDTYDDAIYSSYKELNEAGLLGSDTWEAFEPHSILISSLGYNGMVIYEGGIENFLVFNKEKFIEEI